MPLKYDFFQVNELNKTKGKYRARAVSTGIISTERLTKWISQVSGISAAEAKGFIEVLTDAMIDFLKNGYEVEVGNLGYFTASVTSPLVDSPTEIRAESIHFNRLNFRANVKTKKRLAYEGVERTSKPRNKSKVKLLTRQQRADRLRDFLAQQPVATRADYSRLTGIAHNASAVADLNEFIKEGWLNRYGAGRNVVYMLKHMSRSSR